MRKTWMGRLGFWVFLGVIGHTSLAAGGVPECGNIRIDATARCELRLGADCRYECGPATYTKTCTTRTYERCHDECEVPATVVCVDDCSEQCTSSCTRGVDVVCKHNCYPECTEGCKMSCLGAADPTLCLASCEATCDGECTSQCSELPPETTCYEHCTECCTGSCRAVGAMGCQTICQADEIESCYTEVDQDCVGGCEGSGGLFCDGQFILAGEDLGHCVNALVNLDINVGELALAVLSDDQQAQIEAASDDLSAAAEELQETLNRDGGVATGAGVLDDWVHETLAPDSKSRSDGAACAYGASGRGPRGPLWLMLGLTLAAAVSRRSARVHSGRSSSGGDFRV